MLSSFVDIILMYRFELLKVLTENGKKVDYIEEIIGPFLLKWLPEVITTGRYVCHAHSLVLYNLLFHHYPRSGCQSI